MILTTEELKKKNYSNPLYTVYLGMKKRCYTPSTTGFENYGGKGIQVCEEWKNDFSVFYEWAIRSGYYYNTEDGRIEVDQKMQDVRGLVLFFQKIEKRKSG